MWWHAILASLFSVIVLFIMARLIGYRQVSELSVFDYINGITIGSIAAELAIAPLDEILVPLIAMAIYTGATILLSFITDRSIRARRFLIGEPVLMFRGGRFFYKNFKKEKIDLGEFLMQCREQGYFDLAEVDTVFLEPNGKLSILPKADKRPATPSDLGAPVKPASVPGNVITDGAVLEENLTALGFDRIFLDREMKKQNAPATRDIFLATLDTDGVLTVYPKSEKDMKDILS